MKNIRELIRNGVAPELLHWASCPQKDGGGATPQAPKPTDPMEVINAQVAGQPNVVTPFYKRTKYGSPETNDYTISEEYSPDVQQQFDTRNAVANSMMGNMGQNWMNFKGPSRHGSAQIDAMLPSDGRFAGGRMDATNDFFQARPDAPFDWTEADSQKVTDAYWNKQKGLLDKAFGEQGERLDQKLANQGLPMGSEAYGQEMDRYETGRADAYTRAAQDAVQLGAQEDQRKFGQAMAERGQYFSDLGALGSEESRRSALKQGELGTVANEQQRQYNMIASALGMPQGGFVPSGGGGAIDPTQAFQMNQAGQNAKYQGQLAGYNADVASANSTNAGLMGLGSAAMMAYALSDRRFKKDIVMVGELMPGINLYEFEYTFGSPRIVGVMADEVENVMPEAVMTDERGVRFVNYSKLLSRETIQ